MSLTIIPIVKKGNDTVSYNLLICTSKVLDFYQDKSLQTVFYYSDTEGQRYKAIKYTTSYTKNQFHAKIREVLNEKWINIQILEKDRKTLNPAQIMKLNVERLVYGRNTKVNGFSGFSYIWIERGSNKPHLRLLTTHTIEDLSRSSSTSASLSPS